VFRTEERRKKKKKKKKKKGWLDIYAYITTRRGAQREMKIRGTVWKKRKKKEKKTLLVRPRL